MVKVRFLLPREDDGWPPAESEGLWAEPLGEDRFDRAIGSWESALTAERKRIDDLPKPPAPTV
jgi:hypothetical protein